MDETRRDPDMGACVNNNNNKTPLHSATLD